METLTGLLLTGCMTNNNSHGTTLVVGGTGKTGRRVAERLQARDLPVRIGSRSGAPPFDWEDRSTWAPALQGTAAAYVSYFPDLAVPGAPEAIAAFAEQALAAGTRRLVLLSGRGEEEAQRAEQALAETDAEWTIVRCTWFSQNFSESYLLEPVLAGEVVLPTGSVTEPFVDADDLADVAVAALTEPGHDGKTYELAGPRLLTFGDAADEIAKASGRAVTFLPVSAEEFATGLAAQSVPPDLVEFFTHLFTKVLDGRNSHLTRDIAEILGRPARDFRDYAKAAAATGVWGVDR